MNKGIKDSTFPIGKGLNILYVDDDTDDQVFFEEALKAIDIPHKLFRANSCAEMMNFILDQQAFDIIFLDINMPAVDGKMCLKELKSHKKYNQIPVVILTVSKNPSDVEDVYNLGAHFHVVKPYAHINFVASLKTVFALDWKQFPPVPSKDKFTIDYSYRMP